MKSFLLEFWDYLKVRKKFWLTPVFLLLFALGALIIFGKGTAMAPFVYTIF
jgi:hypothetical protein